MLVIDQRIGPDCSHRQKEWRPSAASSDKAIMRADPDDVVVSFVIATHNRREVLLHTLDRLRACEERAIRSETLVVDNASTDGTAGAVRRRFPQVTLLREEQNRGPCAKNAALKLARGKFIVFLDDDSFPQPGSISRMIEHFDDRPDLGAAVFTITLPDGSQECSAYPDVCIGCGTGFRRRALEQVGGLPDDFFMAAEEYDLSLRLLDAVWSIQGFNDLYVTHLKTPQSRFARRITRLDARNNTLLALRYFPDPWRELYAGEWLARYRLIAAAKGHGSEFWRGAAAGIAQGLAAEHRPISPTAFERFARVRETESRLRRIARQRSLRAVLYIDHGKNMPAYRLAAEACGLRVTAIADESLGGRQFSYHGIPILTDAQARDLPFDAAIVSNLSPVHARRRRDVWRATLHDRPVIDLFETSCQSLVASCQ